MIDEYDTGIWYADRQLGLVFDKLREQGIYDDMAIIISSDHGEDLGEMGSYCEHGEADYVTTHIPLIVKWPGCARNAVSAGFHYNVDLLPTLVDLLGGVPPFSGNRVVGKPNPVKYDGTSFADCVRTGEDGGRDHLVVSQCAHVCQRSVRFGDWIYIRTYHDGYHLTAAEELFNVKDDPHETRDLAEENPELCWKGAWYLERWVADAMLYLQAGRETSLPADRALSKGAGLNRAGNTYSNMSQNWIVYRLTDILLMQAEAMVQLAASDTDSKLGQAFNIVQAVNSRSLDVNSLGTDSLKYENYTGKEAMEELVLAERLRELCFEGKRWFDLLRIARRDYKRDQATFSTNLVNAVRTKLDEGADLIASRLASMDALYWPIYEDELDRNTLLKQNAYYLSTAESDDMVIQ